MGIRSFVSKIQEEDRIAKPTRGLQNDRRNNCQSPADFQKVCRALYARGQNEKNQVQGPGFFGACGRTRTGDLLITSELLYQLSHTSRAFQAGIIIASFSSRVNSHFFRGRREIQSVFPGFLLMHFPGPYGFTLFFSTVFVKITGLKAPVYLCFSPEKGLRSFSCRFT